MLDPMLRPRNTMVYKTGLVVALKEFVGVDSGSEETITQLTEQLQLC